MGIEGLPEHLNGNGNGHASSLPALNPEHGVGDLRYVHPPDSEEIHFSEYWDRLLRHRWTALAFLATVVVSTLLVTLATVPTFKATTLIEIKAESQKVVAFHDVVQMSQVEHEFYQTQYDVLQSRTLAKRVIDRLKLADDPSFNQPSSATPGLFGRLGALFGRSAPTGAASDETVAEQRLVDRFLRGVDINPRRSSYLVEVSFLSANPKLGADAANAMAEEFVSLALDQRLEAVQKGRAFIERQLGVTKAALEHSEEDLQAFARANEILSVDAKTDIAQRKLNDLNVALTRAQNERMGKESLYNQVMSGDAGTLSQLTNNPVIANLTGVLATREAEHARLAATFTEEYPKMRRLRAQIDALRSQIQKEQETLAGTLRADFEASRKQEGLLQEALEAQKKAVRDLNQRAIDYKILEREVDTNRSIYNSLLQRLKEVEVTEGIKASNIQVVDVAEVPAHPFRPRPLVNLALAFLVGSVGAVGLVMLLDRLDSSIKTPEDVERYLRLPIIGALPQLRMQPRGQDGESATPELIVVEDPKSAGAEALRTLRASLFLSTAAGPPQRLLVTSARPQEGKTCVTANLAIILAQMGRRVILVDCDFRRPRVHRIFGQELDVGVTNFLTGNMDLPSLIRHSEFGVDVLTSGPVPPNPVELIDSAPMASLLDELSRRYDFVLLDAPPAIGFADVPLLARLAGGVLFVVRAGETPRKVASTATEHLLRLRARILGVVLNGVRTNGPGYYYSGYYYYSYKSDGDDAANGAANGHDRTLVGTAAEA